ncbi:hypothetical protein ACFY36_03790 [Actinoplanes sp. NPDC000266]
MGRAAKVIVAVVLVVGGLTGIVVVLAGEGLDRAEKWTSLIGMFVSVAIGLAGLLVAWRQTGGARVSRTGNATATGPGSVAVSGSAGAGPATAVDRTGDAIARDGGRAVSGEDR